MAGSTFAILSWLTGLPLTGQVLIDMKAVFDFQVPAALAGTAVDTAALTNPTATATYNVNKNGSSIGTIQIATNGAVTLAGLGASFSAAAGDVLQIVAPNPQDTTLANVSISLFCTR